jgi:FKBP-type peptidyl-prolyl cis-trans isomerase FkpA
MFLPHVSEMLEKRMEAMAAAQKKKGEAFAAAFAKDKGVRPIPNGHGWIKTLREGAGDRAAATDTVKVDYAGTLIDGKEFDSSYKRGEPATFPLAGVIPCWTDGVAMMKVGEKAELVCPSDAAYGDHGHPPAIPGGSTLVFKVELKEIVKPSSDKK